MLKKMWMRIQPHIIPEMLLFIKYILPIGMLLSFSIYLTDADYMEPDPFKLWLWGVLLCVGGIYIMRIIAYLIYNAITNIGEVAPDIYAGKQPAGKKGKRK